MRNKKILVAVLNWGLGHATRCIPIICELESQNFEVILASDGDALLLLKKEFPHLRTYSLPSYNIRYSKTSLFFTWKILRQTPHILRTIKEENKVIETLIEKENIAGVISDNRWGAYSKKINSVIITHQLNVISGATTFISSKIQQKQLGNFEECWVPDVEGENNLSGRLGHLRTKKLKINYLGIISRFKKQEELLSIDILIILSGPQPQREILEKKLLKEFKSFKGNVIMVRGIVESQQIIERKEHITCYNYMKSEELETFLNISKLVISRSGYTTLLDLTKLQKKAFFIPTPGQPEQEYLAARLKKLNIANSCKQKDFNLKMLETNDNYSGLVGFNGSCDLGSFFTLFQSE